MKREYNVFLEQKYKKGELILTLKEYKGIFSQSIYSYLYALINNEFSVVRNYISNEDREVLSRLNIFNKISMYNINKRALDIFKKFDSEQVSELVITSYSSKEVPRVTAEIGSSEVTLFGTNNACIKLENPYNFLPSLDEKTVINPIVIPLYKSIIDSEKVYSEIERIKAQLKYLETAKNPFSTECIPKEKRHKHVGSGGYAEQWIFDKQLKIESLNRQIEELNKQMITTSQEEKQIIADITSQVFKLFLDDYGLKEEDINKIKESKGTHKKYVRKAPGLTIEKNINYL